MTRNKLIAEHFSPDTPLLIPDGPVPLGGIATATQGVPGAIQRRPDRSDPSLYLTPRPDLSGLR